MVSFRYIGVLKELAARILWLGGLEVFSWSGKGVWLSKFVQGLESQHGAMGAFPGLEDTCSLGNVGVKETLKTK